MTLHTPHYRKAALRRFLSHFRSTPPLLIVFVCSLATGASAEEPAMGMQVPAKGAEAPNLTLLKPTGHPVSLASELKKNTAVLVVLRGFPGYKCPYYVRQVHDFVGHVPDFAAKHVNVLLVYPRPLRIWTSTRRSFLPSRPDLPQNIQLVTDPDYKMTNQYGLRWDAPHETAYPSTFILGGRGTILFEKISHSHDDRTTAEKVLAQISATM